MMNGRKREAMCPASYVVKPIPERGQTTGMANRTPKKTNEEISGHAVQLLQFPVNILL